MRYVLLAILLQWRIARSFATSQGCAELLNEFIAYSTKDPAPLSKESLVFFLHIPRTAGRTLHSCLLKRGTMPSQRCPKSYDHIRIANMSMPDCHLLSTHDDYSILQHLPSNTAVVTQLRDPVDRFLSSYEFAVALAAREVTKRTSRKTKRRPARPVGVKTADVWPWSMLMPWFAEHITDKLQQAKQEAMPVSKQEDQQSDLEEQLKSPSWSSAGDDQQQQQQQQDKQQQQDQQQQQQQPSDLDPYNNSLLMPLAEFVKHPIAEELLHNGQAMQILGLTNYSSWPSAPQLRQCVMQHTAVADQLLQIALQRLERFVHVGSTGQLMESAEAAAAALGLDLNGPAYSPREQKINMKRRQALVHHGDEDDDDSDGDLDEDLRTDDSSSSSESSMGTSGAQQRDDDDAKLGLPLGSEFQRCSAHAHKRSKAIERRFLSGLSKPLGDQAVIFSKEARKTLPQAVLDEIRRRNALDIQLHTRAVELLQLRRQQYRQQHRLQQLKPLRTRRNSGRIRHTYKDEL